MDGLSIVNIIGSGKIDSEVDLATLEEELSLSTVYTKGPGLYFKFHEDGPTVVLARSGKYFISGAESQKRLETARSKTLELLTDVGLIENQKDLKFSVKNIVFTYDVGNKIRLTTLATVIGLEDVEYEPEQFPALIYRSESAESVALIFSSGKIVVTGVINHDSAKRTIDEILGFLTEVTKESKN